MDDATNEILTFFFQSFEAYVGFDGVAELEPSMGLVPRWHRMCTYRNNAEEGCNREDCVVQREGDEGLSQTGRVVKIWGTWSMERRGGRGVG